jgi:hypothetical protein
MSSEPCSVTLADRPQALPAYTILLDKWIDGTPDNNDFFGLKYEYDYKETQLRAGGDAVGLMDPRGLDYLQSMGIKTIYIAGTNFVNMPWQADGECSATRASSHNLIHPRLLRSRFHNA